MSDIFISYASEDSERVEPLARALEAEGWSTFWDKTIPAGESWVKYIGKALDEARCVVVIWSQASVESSWVYEEAERGRQRDVLIPVLFDNVSIPLGFSSVQAAKLIAWDGTTTSQGFQQFRISLERRLGASQVAKQHKVDEKKHRQSAKGEPDRKEQKWQRQAEEIDHEERRPESQGKLKPRPESEDVQRAPERARIPTKEIKDLKVVRKILPGRVVLLVIAGAVAVLFMRYAWTQWVKKSPVNEAEMSQVSKVEPPKNEGSVLHDKTAKTKAEEPNAIAKSHGKVLRRIELNSVYLDSATRLMWTKNDNGQDVTWRQANDYCRDLRLGDDSDWRLPTIEELERLYDRDRKGSSHYIIRKPLELTACCPWSSTKEGSGSAWFFYFNLGTRGRPAHLDDSSSSNRRALCVRGP